MSHADLYAAFKRHSRPQQPAILPKNDARSIRRGSIRSTPSWISETPSKTGESKPQSSASSPRAVQRQIASSSQHKPKTSTPPHVPAMDNTSSLLTPSTSLRGFQEGSDDVGRAIHDSSDWLNFFQLGTIVQGRTKLLICKRRKEQSPLYMFKHLEDTQEAIGRRLLGMEHPSIVQARCIVQDISGQQIGYDYVKFTLQEVLSTHLPLQESHLRLIATSASNDTDCHMHFC